MLRFLPTFLDKSSSFCELQLSMIAVCVVPFGFNGALSPRVAYAYIDYANGSLECVRVDTN